MKPNKKKWLLYAVSAVFVFGLLGCSSKPKPKPTPTPKPVITEKKKPSNVSYAWVGFPQPCPTPQDAKILIEKTSPRVVKPGQVIEIKVAVKNNEKHSIDKITIEEKMPSGFKVRNIKPKPSSSGDGVYVWELENIRPRQKKTIVITGKIEKTGTVRYAGNTVLNFEVSGKPEGETVVAVVAPGLEFELDAPAVSVINEKIPVRFTLKNTGTADVKGAKIIQTLPPGILTNIGRSKVEIVADDIAPGESKQYGYYLKGVKKGNYKSTFTVVAQDGLSASDTLNLRITVPKLTIKLDGPKKRFVGDFISYKIDVKNVGDSIAETTAVSLMLPDGVALSSVNENGKTSQNQVVWDVESIHPGQSKTFIAKVVAKKNIYCTSCCKRKPKQ